MSTTTSRFRSGAVVTSQPIHIFPNGDYFFVEVRRKNGRYECTMKIAQTDSNRTVPVTRALAPTVREVQQRCYENAVEKCPRLPRPPYLKRGGDIVKVGV